MERGQNQYQRTAPGNRKGVTTYNMSMYILSELQKIRHLLEMILKEVKKNEHQ